MLYKKSRLVRQCRKFLKSKIGKKYTHFIISYNDCEVAEVYNGKIETSVPSEFKYCTPTEGWLRHIQGIQHNIKKGYYLRVSLSDVYISKISPYELELK